MRKLRGWILRFGGLFGQQRRNRELDDEIESHLQMHIEDNLRLGMSPEEARRQAMIKLGGIESAKEAYRDQRGLPWLETLWQDIRYGARQLRSNPGFTSIVAITLSLGIGSSTTLSSVIYGMLLKPLPHERPGQLVTLRESSDGPVVAGGVFNDWREYSTSFESMTLLRAVTMTFSGQVEAKRALVWMASPTFLNLLGAPPRIGRDFLPQEGEPGGDSKVVLLAESFAKRTFGDGANPLGQTIRLDNDSYSIIGVLPSDAFVMGGPDLIVPLVLTHDVQADRVTNMFSVWGRLKPGASITQAETELRAIKERLRSRYPKEKAEWRSVVIPVRTWLFGYVRPTVLILQWGALCVLVMAGINAAGLLMARTIARWDEIALRVALGAGRMRIARQFLTESVLLGLLGGIFGTLLSLWGVKLLRLLLYDGRANPEFFNWAADLDTRMLLFSFLVSLATGIILGLLPAVTASTRTLNGVLKETARSLAGGPRSRIRHGLMISQIALSLTLLVVAGLLLKSVVSLLNVPLGYEPNGLMSTDVLLPQTKYPDEASRARFFQQVFERLMATPGVEAVAAVSTLPTWPADKAQVHVEGREEQPEGGYPCLYDVVRGRYCRTMGVVIRKGRDLTEGDFFANASPVCVIDELLARRLFADGEPIGRRLRIEGNVYEIVGIVSDTRHGDLINGTLGGHLHLSQAGRLPAVTPWLFVRTDGDPAALYPLVRRELQEVDPDQTVDFATSREDILSTISDKRVMLKVLSAFAGIAVGLAAIGLYGVITYEVTRRTNEFGIRLALGAQRSDILGLVLKKGMSLSIVGIMLGIVGALATSQAIRSHLYGTGLMDPLILAGAVSGFLLVALAACWLPARRAAQVDPMVALRAE